MYSETREKMLSRRASVQGQVRARRDYAPRPGRIEAPLKAPWAGRFTPKILRTVQPLGGLADDGDWTGNTGPQQEISTAFEATPQPIPDRSSVSWLMPSTVPTVGTPSIPVTAQTVGGGGGSIWDSLFSGVAKVITPAAQALIGIKAQGAIAQAQQKTMAQTWNPALTGPALQAQAYQSAYLSGTGASPISTTTLLIAGVGLIGLMAVMSRR